MSLLSLAQWIQSTAVFTALRESSNAYPLVLTGHLAGIAIFGGMILIADLRLLGLLMRRRTVSDVVGQLRIPKRIGFLIVATCGLLMLSAKAEEYYYNPFFRTKLILFALVALHAAVFHRSVYANTAELDKASRMPWQAKLAACLSLILWVGVAIAGRGIGYIEPPLDRIHAGLTDSRRPECCARPAGPWPPPPLTSASRLPYESSLSRSRQLDPYPRSLPWTTARVQGKLERP